MKLIFVIAAIFIIGCNAGSPSFSPMSLPSVVSHQSCADIKLLIDQLSWTIREILKQQILLHPRALDITGITGSNFLFSILSNILSNNNVVTFDNILLHSILSPTIIIPKSEFGLDLDATYACLIEIFSA